MKFDDGASGLEAALAKAIGPALFAAGEMLSDEAQDSITRGSVSGRNHVPSAPGSPPNNDTGVLKGNIETVQINPFLVEVSSNAPYAANLEFGTSKMEARPYMRPARNKVRKEAQRLVRDAVNRAMRQQFGK